MSKNLKLFFRYLVYHYISIVFFFYFFLISKYQKLNEFSYYKELQNQIEIIIGKNLYLNLFYFFLFCLIWVSLLGFGSPLLLISGILFENGLEL